MNKPVLRFSLASLLFLATACGTTEEPITKDPVQEGQTAQTETPDQNNNTANNHAGDADPNQEEMQAKMDELNYSDFELEVEYGDNKKYEAENKRKKNDRIDTEIEDDLNDIYLKGKEAFDILFPLLQQLNVDQNTNKDDTIEEILTVFELPGDYTTFEIEITFDDGSKIDYEDKNK